MTQIPSEQAISSTSFINLSYNISKSAIGIVIRVVPVSNMQE
jgi:hypothetical protein